MNEKHFQNLQNAFASYVRNPSEPYQGESLGGLPIESRRLAAYDELVFNNFDQFFSKLFPVCNKILTDADWQELLRNFVKEHRCQSPLFHELGQEFLEYIQVQDKVELPPFMLELAHYEWVEMAVSIEEIASFETHNEVLDFNVIYQWSDLGWPLAYQWPVDEISEDYLPEVPPEEFTCVLVYRDKEYRVQFIKLTPALYQLLTQISESETQSLASLIEALAQQLNVDEQLVQTLASPLLQKMIDEGLMTQR